MVLAPGLAHGQADEVSAAYAAFTGGDHAAARDLAREAIAIDAGVATIVARKVLILALRELGDPAAALEELSRYMAFDLVVSDRRWADQQEAELVELVPEPAGAPVPEPEVAPVPEPAVAPGPEPEAIPAPPEEPPPGPRPALVLAVGAGFQQLSTWSYAAFGAEAAVRLAGPLWLELDGQFALSPNADCSEATGDEDACTALFTTIGIGPRIRLDGPANPYLHVAFELGVNGNPSPYTAVVPGFEVGGGIELGKGVVSVRPRAAFRLFGPLEDGGAVVPGVLVGVDLALRVGGRS